MCHRRLLVGSKLWNFTPQSDCLPGAPRLELEPLLSNQPRGAPEASGGSYCGAISLPELLS
jgi:hypothetical protein